MQAPRIECLPDPPGTGELGQLAVDLCDAAGLHLDPWQAWVLRTACAEDGPGRWSAFEVGLMISRQNGKTALIEARELVGLFVLGEQLIIHSAHRSDTAENSWRRLRMRIASCPTLEREIARAPAGKGAMGITLKSGASAQFRTRTGGGGLGFSADCLVLDEAMDLPTSFLGDLMPTLAARPNPQVWYTGSAVDQDKHRDGLAFSRVRDRAKRRQPRLFYAEWSAADSLADVTPDMLDDPEAWARANPALDIRITRQFLQDERHSSMPARQFAVMHLGAGDWPATTEDAGRTIPPADWKACESQERAAGPTVLTFDVSPTRSRSCIARATKKSDGKVHVEIVDHRRGDSPTWIVDRLLELVRAESPRIIALDARGPAGALVPHLEPHDRQVRLTLCGAPELTQACGVFFDAVLAHSMSHAPSAELDSAVDGAERRSVGDAWSWSRRNSTVDISPLVAVTLAHSAATSLKAGVGVASASDYLARHTPEEIAAKRKAHQEKVEAILARARGRQQ